MTQGKISFGPFPLRLGHEGVGEIVAVGEGVTSRKVGDRVGVCKLQTTCGKCDYCNKEADDFRVCCSTRLLSVAVDKAFEVYGKLLNLVEFFQQQTLYHDK